MNNHRKQYLIIILIFTCALIQNAIAFQQVKTYTIADGLLDAVVPVIFQDSRGMLWFGSEQGGVSRFDGKTITAYGAISENFYGRTQNIVEDKWGHIWFLNKRPSQDTGVIIRYNGNTFEYLSDGNCLISDKAGDIWVGNNNILTRYTATNSQEIPKALQLNVGGNSGASINTIFQSRDGTIWIGGSDGQGVLILRLKGEINIGQAVNLSRFNNLPNLPQYRAIQSIAQDTEDNLWFGGKSLLLRYDGSQFEQFIDSSIKTQSQNGTFQKPIILNRDSVSVKSDTQGRIWYSDNKQLRWCDGNNLHRLGTLSVEANQEIYLQGTYGIEDARGRLWFATEKGVHLYENNDNREENISNTQLKSTLAGTTELRHKVFQVNDGLGSDNILTIFEAIDGTIWFGHDNGVTALQPQPAIVQYGTRSILGSSSVKLMFPDSMATLWLSIPGGVARYVPQDDELYKYPLPNITLEQDGNPKIDRPTEIVEIFEIDGGLWFLDKPIRHQKGFTHHRIFRYTNGVFHKLSIQIRAKIGQNGEPIFSDPKLIVSSNTDPWFALSGWLFLPTKIGLYRILQDNNTERIAFDTIENLPSSPDNIIALHTDSQNQLWCHLETGEVKRYTHIRSGNNQTVGKIQEEKLTLNSIFPILVVPENKSTKWFYNTKKDSLIYWKNAPTEISNTSGKPQLLVVHTSLASPESEQNTSTGNTNNELATICFKNSIKTYQGTELIHESSVEIDKITNALVASDGDIWLATTYGAIRYNSKETTSYTKADGFIVDDLRDVKEDKWGNIWFATWGGGLLRYNGDTFESITTKDGLIHNNVSSIHVSDQEDLWFGTEGGATQYRVSRGALPFCRIISVNTGKATTDTLRTESAKHTMTDITELIPARNKYLTIQFQGINPLGGDVAYKFKLIGIDNNAWTTVYPNNPQGHITTFDSGIHQYFLPQTIGTSQDFPRIRYQGLKPGNYTFLINAYREGWHYTQQPSVLNFTIDKPLWTRWRTYLPSLIVFVVVSYLLFRLIVNRRHTAQLRQEMRQKEEAEIQRIRDELNEAQNIQMALLPTEPPQTQSYDIAGKSIPATQVGGDFFDYLTVANGRTAIAVADAAGKGIRGAMNAVLTNGMLNEIAHIKSDANVILRDLNIGLAPRMYGHNFIALNLAILDENGTSIDYANGGQPYPILKRGTEIIEFTNSDLPLGSMKKVEYESVTYDFEDGDILIIHSDGLIEALNSDEEMYGTERLINLTSKIPNDFTAEEIVQHIVDDVQAFVEDAEQYDDLTLVVVKCTTASNTISN